MSGSLFREEALDAQRGSWLGAISLAQPAPLWVMTTAAVAAALAIALLLTLGSYTRRSSVTGRLVPARGVATLLAPATGVVAALEVSEGAQVRAGQPLIVVDLPRATLREGDTAVAMDRRMERRRRALEDAHGARGGLLAAQDSGLTMQLGDARHELAQLEQEVATGRRQARIADETLQRLRKLQADRYVSALQVKEQEAAWLQAVAGMQDMQRQVAAARRSVAELQQARQELPEQRRASDADFQRDLAALEEERVEADARGALVVNAPVAGVVATQLVKAGQTVQAGQPMLSVLQGDGILEAELLVPSRSIGFIEPGDSVLLRYEAYPYQKFGHHRGTVVRISRRALDQGELQALLGTTAQSEPLYRVTVRLARQAVTVYGAQEPLKPGMALEADLLGEKRRLIEWIFEPLYSLKGTIG
jgi:membrane fusion protein